jgi:hypothetical protein
MNYIIFPKERHEKNVDAFFKEEWDAARKAGFQVGYAIADRIKDTPMSCGLYLPKFEHYTAAIYRGWIVPNIGQFYYGFYHSLRNNNHIELINSPQSYQNAQLLTESYPYFSKYTIPTVFSNSPTKKLLKLIGKQFKTNNIFVKDYVKSEHGLNTLNLIDLDGALETLENLKKERQNLFEGGFAFRPFVELSGNERRLWIYRGRILNFEWESLPNDFKPEMVRHICSYNSMFYTVDVGRYKSGEPVIIETGDAQVSGLKGLTPDIFYKALKKIADEY